jgi:hypothetical protein
LGAGRPEQGTELGIELVHSPPSRRNWPKRRLRC